ncbi:MAG: MaoC family dehydratase [Clostridiales bacterium]|nr:MaoC family dehydratase [Clostridiales bacterium]
MAEKLHIGDKASLLRKITEEDIHVFAQLTGDFNKIHTNEYVAKKAGFEKCIAHGMLTGSLISTVIGTLLPGEGTIYLEQDLKFKKPLYCDDVCVANVCVSEIINEEKQVYRLETTVENQKKEVLIEGFAVVKL